MQDSDKTTFYVRNSPYSDQVKQFISHDLAELTLDYPAIEVDLSVYGKNDSTVYSLSDTTENFVAALAKSGTGDKRYIEKVFITGAGFIEIAKATSCSWPEAMTVIEAALEQITGGDQVNLLPFDLMGTRSLAGTAAR